MSSIPSHNTLIIKASSTQQPKPSSKAFVPIKYSSVYKRPLTIKQQIDEYFMSAKVSKEKIDQGLEFVKTIENYNQDQRCLEHNNVITLYCLNDRKLLCVYCIYGLHKHRNHKLLPTLEYLFQIAEDVVQLQKQYTHHLSNLQNVIDSSKGSIQIFQNLMKKSLSQIQGQYIRKKQELENLYKNQKDQVTRIYQNIIQKTHEIMNINQDIKFSIWQFQAKYSLDKALRVSLKDLKAQKAQKQHDSTKEPPLLPKEHKQILSKHVVFNHLVQEMAKIKLISFNEVNLEKRIINKANFKLLNNYMDTKQQKSDNWIGIGSKNDRKSLSSRKLNQKRKLSSSNIKHIK